MKCTANPDSTSHTNLACYFYRKANGLPISARHGPGLDRSKDSSQTRTGGTPPAGNGSQNLVLAKADDEVDSTEIFTTDNEEYEGNMAQLCDDSESVDSQEYYSDEQPNHGEDATKYKPPMPPRPRDGEGAF